MDIKNQQMILITFFSQYYAFLLKQTLKDRCTLKSVPRSLSSSCGICALINEEDFPSINVFSDNIDRVFYINDNKYEEIIWKK